MGSVERMIVRVSLSVVISRSACSSNHIRLMMTVSPEAFDAAHAQCWCGQGSAHRQASTSTSTNITVHNHVTCTQIEFPWQNGEDDKAGAPITTIDHWHGQLGLSRSKNTTGPHAEHELRLIISGYRWVASSTMGTFSHEASDLADDKENIASLALLDTLTRWLLPHWQGGVTLHVRTNDLCVLRGIRGDYYSHSGVWKAVRSLCGQYDVQLSAKVVERSSSSASASGTLFARGNTRGGKGTAEPLRKALRNPDVVNSAVKWLTESGQQGSTVYRIMLNHLTV